MSEAQPSATVSWEVVAGDGQWFVEERIAGQQGFVRYGPMHRDAAGPLIDERREFFDDAVKKHSGRVDPIAHASV